MPTSGNPHAAAPVEIDTSKASVARVYDACLDGKDNYEVDRGVLRSIQQVVPEVKQMAYDNRDFLIRSVRFLSRQCGMTQFLDCGSGLPTAENVHEVAQRVNPEARIVYVDNDPVVIAHGRALLEENDLTAFVAADIFDPREVLEHPRVNEHLDLSQPFVLLQNGTVHHYNGEPSAVEMMQEYVRRLPSGSYLALTHFMDPEDDETAPFVRDLEDRFVRSPMGSGWFRPRGELLRMLDGLELIEPGLVPSHRWWPDGPQLQPAKTVQGCIASALGRKP